MELNFSWGRLLVLFLLVAFFAGWGGFVSPSSGDSMTNPHQAMKAWRYCVMLFLAGAVSVSIIDHFVGTLDRSNLRFLYVILGVILMGSSCLWLRTLRRSATDPSACAAEALQTVPLLLDRRLGTVGRV